MIEELCAQEMVTAGTVGLRRQIFALTNRLRPTDGAEDNFNPRAFDHHIISAMAEYVVARRLNLFWDCNVGLVKKGDVGGIIEVRARRADGSGLDLVLKPKDVEKAPDSPFILVHCRAPKFDLVGWVYGEEVLDPAKGAVWSKERGIWFLPAGNVKPMEALDVQIWIAGRQCFGRNGALTPDRIDDHPRARSG